MEPTAVSETGSSTGSATVSSTTASSTPHEGMRGHPSPRIALGARGEAIAAAYLEGCGFDILDRNWRGRSGELDLVARDGNTLVAIEVKTRSGTGYGSPLAAITSPKSARLRRLLYDWMRAHDAHAERLRIDAFGILLRKGDAPCIDHLRGIS